MDRENRGHVMKMGIILLSALVLLTGCVPSEKQVQTAIALTLTAMPTNTPIPTKTPPPTLTPTRSLTPTLTNTPTSISTSTPTLAPLTIEEVIGLFVEAGLPITDIIYYTEETDPNQLLGRPNQYIAKVNWTDERIDSWQDGVQAGGSIELFLSPTNMQARKDYLESVTQIMSATVEYAYSNAHILLRLSHSLTPTQAQEYESILMSIP